MSLIVNIVGVGWSWTSWLGLAAISEAIRSCCIRLKIVGYLQTEPLFKQFAQDGHGSVRIITCEMRHHQCSCCRFGGNPHWCIWPWRKIFPVRECKPILKEVPYEDGFTWPILCTMIGFHATASIAVILCAMAWSWEAAGYLWSCWLIGLFSAAKRIGVVPGCLCKPKGY